MLCSYTPATQCPCACRWVTELPLRWMDDDYKHLMASVAKKDTYGESYRGLCGTSSSACSAMQREPGWCRHASAALSTVLHPCACRSLLARCCQARGPATTLTNPSSTRACPQLLLVGQGPAGNDRDQGSYKRAAMQRMLGAVSVSEACCVWPSLAVPAAVARGSRNFGGWPAATSLPPSCQSDLNATAVRACQHAGRPLFSWAFLSCVPDTYVSPRKKLTFQQIMDTHWRLESSGLRTWDEKVCVLGCTQMWGGAVSR